MTKPATALVLSGGGARGAYQVGVLKALAETVPRGQQPFPIITGVSVGALNASVLAADGDDFPKAVENLEKIWRGLHCSAIYRTDMGAVASNLLRWMRAILFGWAGAAPPNSLLDNSPLGKLLDQHVDFAHLNRLAGASGLEALAITASSYATGRAITFFKSRGDIEPWRRARRIGLRCDFSPKHVLASSALPVVFPSVDIDGVWFGDGALRENAPLSAAIHLGCERILTIAARDGTPDDFRPGQSMPYPSVGDIAGNMLDIIFNDNADADIERLTRINKTLDLLPPDRKSQTKLRPIDIVSIIPSNDIRVIAGEHAAELPSSVKLVLRAMGALKAPWVLPSYLTFEPGYIGALIDLGYQDAIARCDELKGFLGLEA